MSKKKEAIVEEPNRTEDNEKIQSLLFQHVEKPKNIQDTKILNVYYDNYRINVWTTVEEGGFTKNKIHASYMTKYKNGALEILLPKPSLGA